MTTDLFQRIDTALEEIGHGWTSPDQAHKLAEAILTGLPAISVEIGVYAGKGLIAMALAHKEIRLGKVIGIDPWSATASSQEQLDPEHHKFWSNLDHEQIYRLCMANIEKFGVQDYVEIIRAPSDEVMPPERIGVLRIDGNHGPQADRDVRRFCPKVTVGGILHLDDLYWKGGASESGSDRWLEANGWAEIGLIDTGAIFRRML